MILNLLLKKSSLHFPNRVNVSDGLSDFHKMIATVSKTIFTKMSSLQRYYRCYSCYNNIDAKFNAKYMLYMYIYLGTKNVTSSK